VTVSTQNVQSSGDHLAVNTNGSITVGFSHFGGLPLFVEVNALVSRLSTGPGYAPFSLSLNGTAFVTDYTVPGGGYGYADNVFVVPGALVRDGANQLVLSVGSSQSFLWVRAVELLAIFDGPNYSTSLGTAATSYSARNDINQVPLAFLLAYPSAMLTTLDRVLEMDDSLTLHAAIAAMQQMTQFWPWIVQQVTSALSAGSLQLSDTTISSGTQAAADLLNVVGYVTTRGAQELDRLLAIDHGKPATLDYTRGANVEPLIQARLAQIGPVQPAGTAFAFTDDATGTTYTFATATVAANKRTAYAGLIRCGIVQANLEQVDASLARLAAGVPSPEAIAFLPAIAIALVAIGIYALASQYLISQSLPPAEGPKAYKMNWHGWIDDWTSPISYGWWDIPGAGYLKPGNVWNVRLPDGTRADESLASQAPGQNFGPIGGYFNYVWLPGDAYPLRLSYKNPALSPPGETYHSQLAGGAAVGCAGEIQFADGYFRLINTSSGHYYKTEPDWNRCRQQVIDAIAAMGYDMSKVGASAYTGLDLAFIDDFPVDGAGAQL
jgi:hypothetical protein